VTIDGTRRGAYNSTVLVVQHQSIKKKGRFATENKSTRIHWLTHFHILRLRRNDFLMSDNDTFNPQGFPGRSSCSCKSTAGCVIVFTSGHYRILAPRLNIFLFYFWHGTTTSLRTQLYEIRRLRRQRCCGAATVVLVAMRADRIFWQYSRLRTIY
jgi:hypothetical protein